MLPPRFCTSRIAEPRNTQITQTARSKPRGHNLLEVLVATGIFIMVAIAMAGIWSIYGSALAKSSEVLAANQLARGVAEGLMANGFEWLVTPANMEGPAPPLDTYVMERKIRSRTSNVIYNVRYRVLRYDPTTASAGELFTTDVAFLRVDVRWRSDSGSKVMSDGSDYNNQVIYNMAVFRGGLR